MPVTVKRMTLWRRDLENRPGTLATVLDPVAKAGADLQVAMGYRIPGQEDRAVIELAPVEGRKATAAAAAGGADAVGHPHAGRAGRQPRRPRPASSRRRWETPGSTWRSWSRWSSAVAMPACSASRATRTPKRPPRSSSAPRGASPRNARPPAGGKPLRSRVLTAGTDCVRHVVSRTFPPRASSRIVLSTSDSSSRNREVVFRSSVRCRGRSISISRAMVPGAAERMWILSAR